MFLIMFFCKSENPVPFATTSKKPAISGTVFFFLPLGSFPVISPKSFSKASPEQTGVPCFLSLFLRKTILLIIHFLNNYIIYVLSPKNNYILHISICFLINLSYTEWNSYKSPSRAGETNRCRRRWAEYQNRKLRCIMNAGLANRIIYNGGVQWTI